MRLLIHAVLLYVAFAVVSCGQTPQNELPPFCSAPDDCIHLVAGECLVVDCLDGGCVIVADAAANGNSCGMTDPCLAVAGVCDDGTCVGASALVCPVVECMTGNCDPGLGECVYTAAPDGGSCDVDGNPCTADTCAKGECAPGVNRCPCKAPDDCPDMANLCLGRYACGADGCIIEPFSAVACPEPGDCETFECKPSTGVCERTPVADGTICARADNCSEGGICAGGVCETTARCRDDNPCTDDICDSETGACSFPANQASCDDGDACTGPDVCAGGSCDGPIGFCDDFNECTLDGCTPASGCTHAPVQAGTGCLSRDLCVVDTVCGVDGTCGGGSQACDDSNACTSDQCDSLTGACSHANLSGSCDDRNPCTVGERCASGVCGGGTMVPGCCNFDADCDDRDACTPVRCLDARCVAQGQDPDGCPPEPQGCGIDWCDADTGACGTIDTGLPVTLAAWDFEGGAINRGFVWSEPAGVVSPAGLSASGTDHASFLLPRRLVPPGVVMVFLGLSSGDCQAIGFSVTPAGLDCVDFQSRRYVVAAFDTAGAVDAQGRLHVTVTLASGAVLSRAYSYLWRVSGCGADGITAGPATATDLSMDVSMDSVAVLYNTGSDVSATVLSPGGRVNVVARSGDPFAVVSGRFSTSVARSGSGYLAAWGGADDAVVVAPFDSAGWGGSTTMPDMGAAELIEAWPAIAAIPGAGHAIALACGDGTDFDIAVAPIGPEGTPQSDFSRVNDSTTGSRTRPAMLMGQDGGVIGWIAEISGSPARNFVELVLVDEHFNSVGLDVSLGVQDQPINSWSSVYSGEKYFCLWQQVGGVVGGAVVDAETLSVLHPLSFGSAGAPNARPLILAADEGAIALSIQGSGATASIVARTISPAGDVSDPVTVATPVLAGSTGMAAGRFGPAMYMIAFNDHLGDTGGMRIAVFSPACPGGFVDGDAVCTGIGPGGRTGGGLQ